MHHAECNLCLSLAASTNFKACHCRAVPDPYDSPFLPPPPPSGPTAKNQTSCAGQPKPGYTTRLLELSIPATARPPPPMPGRAACPDTVSKAQGRKPLASINTLFSAAGLLKVWNHIPDPPLPPFQPTIPGLSLGAGAGEQSVEPLSRLLMPSPTFSAGLAGSRPFRRHFSPVGLVLGLPSLIPETVTGSAPVTCCAMSMCTSASPAGGKLLKERTVYLRPSSPHPISPTWQGSVVENKGFRIRSVWVQRGDLATCYMSDLRQVFRPL